MKLPGSYFIVLGLLAAVLVCATHDASAQASQSTGPDTISVSSEGKSLTEVNKELSNPISSIWALAFQENTYWSNKPERNVINIQFQPVLPVALTDDWN